MDVMVVAGFNALFDYLAGTERLIVGHFPVPDDSTDNSD